MLASAVLKMQHIHDSMQSSLFSIVIDLSQKYGV
jgi:hypothetical protein